MSAPLTDTASSDNTTWNRVIGVVSLVLMVAIIVLIEGPRPAGVAGSVDVSWMPHLNGAMNTGTTLSLVAALIFIRARNIAAHKASMLAAFGFTTVFLISYVIYHWFKPGPVSYTGPLRPLYLVILISHIGLAPVVVPAALLSLHRGLTDQRASHRKIVRYAYPLWLYVAVTGVLVYAALYLIS